jgi:catechol 2,3-dioxygenase-like lactoylglutathione lyase family enzyme
MKVQQVVPILNVSDVEASFVWFAKLGWSRQFTWDSDAPGAPPGFGGVGCDGYEIFLCRDAQGSRGRGTNTTTGPGSDQLGDQGTWVSIWVDDVDRVHKRCLHKHLEVTYPPTDEPWGVREVHVRHPDGHVFRISQSVDR